MKMKDKIINWKDDEICSQRRIKGSRMKID